MGVMFNKGTNYSILRDYFNVSDVLLNKLKLLGVSLKIGELHFELCSMDNQTHKFCFTTTVANALKNPKKWEVKVSNFIADYLTKIPKNTDIGSWGTVTGDVLDVVSSLGVAKSSVIDSMSSGLTDSIDVAMSKSVLNSYYADNMVGIKKATLIDKFGQNDASVSSLVDNTLPVNFSKASKSLIDVLNMPVVHLTKATELYQRVHGTSAGSIYNVVALNNLVKVAARVTSGNTVSIRFDGQLSIAMYAALESLGFTKSNTKGYSSGHFVCTKCTPGKLIGAILVDCGIKFDTPLPQIKKEVFDLA